MLKPTLARKVWLSSTACKSCVRTRSQWSDIKSNSAADSISLLTINLRMKPLLMAQRATVPPKFLSITGL